MGDLGGGTIDLLISATDIRGNQRFGEVADSAKLGGNLLIETLAQNAAHYLPHSGGWNLNDPAACATQLRAWMRALGSHRLFGPRAANSHHDGLKLKGFENAADGNNARLLIDRYFALITDYMARSLVAYVGKDCWPQLSPEDRDRLRIVVQLRGNGWRLWYGGEKYSKIQLRMSERITRRAAPLWKHVGMPKPGQEWWPNHETSQTRPKIDPITSVVGKNLGPEAALGRSYKFPLSDLELLVIGSAARHVDWFEPLPFKNARDAEPEIGRIFPPIIADDLAIEELEAHLMKEIHDAIQDEKKVLAGSKLDAPIAALIWEKAFLSKQLTVDKKAGTRLTAALAKLRSLPAN